MKTSWPFEIRISYDGWDCYSYGVLIAWFSAPAEMQDVMAFKLKFCAGEVKPHE